MNAPTFRIRIGPVLVMTYPDSYLCEQETKILYDNKSALPTKRPAKIKLPYELVWNR